MDNVHPTIQMIAAIIEYFATRIFAVLKMSVIGGAICLGFATFVWLAHVFAPAA